MNIEYFSDRAVDTSLILIYGDDPTGVEKLRLGIENLINGLIDSVAVHELPDYVSIDDCKLFLQMDRDNLGVWRPEKKGNVFICSQTKETWIGVIEILEPYTDPDTYTNSNALYQFLTDMTRYSPINLLISTRREW
jgi:hypothetical protein